MRSRTRRRSTFRFSTSICHFSPHNLQERVAGVSIHRWHLKRSGQVCINQQNPAASIGAVKSALRSLRSGMPLVIFPEGDAPETGKITSLPGAFFSGHQAQPISWPIALVDTFDLLP